MPKYVLKYWSYQHNFFFFFDQRMAQPRALETHKKKETEKKIIMATEPGVLLLLY